MHGFTDSTLRGDLFSDLQWAMCITCGAWLSTHLFEMASYQAWDRKLVKNSILPIVREALNFFHYHIWFTPSNSCQPLQHPPISLDGVRAHTGPTTSPENSMRIKPINGEIIKFIFPLFSLLINFRFLFMVLFVFHSAIVFDSLSSH
jgi:hypothetical protein